MLPKIVPMEILQHSHVRIWFGSNGTPEGGILGRVDAVYTSIEAQTSTGSLHAHSQVVVQCLHQHTCLSDRLQKRRKQPDNTIQ